MNKISLLIIFVLISCAACSKKPERQAPPPLPITAFQVEKRTIPANFEFVGVAKSSHPVEIRARVEGYLWSIDYTEGSMLNVGDPMFQIDPRQYEASLQEAQGALERQEAVLWRAQRSLQRIQPLYAQNAASLRDLDDATAAVLTAEASVITAKANVYLAELNLSYTKILSPIKGLSARAAFREGTLITPNVNGLLSLVSVIDPIWVLFSVSDNQMLDIRGEKTKSELILPPQQEYNVTLELADGSLFPYKGQVNFASPTLEPSTGSMVVRATFCNPEGLVLPGQFVRVFVKGAKRPDAIFVPQKAITQGQKGMYVFVIEDGKAVIRTVEVGDWYQDYWIIKRGLKEGEIVIADGVNKVQNGSLVKVQSCLMAPEAEAEPLPLSPS